MSSANTIIGLVDPRILLQEVLCFRSRSVCTLVARYLKVRLAKLMAMARDSQSPIFYFCKIGVNIAQKGVNKTVFRQY